MSAAFIVEEGKVIVNFTDKEDLKELIRLLWFGNGVRYYLAEASKIGEIN